MTSDGLGIMLSRRAAAVRTRRRHHTHDPGTAVSRLSTPLIGLLLALAMTLGARDARGQDTLTYHRNVVVNLLKAKKGFPTRDQLLRAGPAKVTNRLLVEIAQGRAYSPALKLNAIRSLEYFPTRRTEQVLMNMLYSKFQKPAYKRTILRSLARAFGVNVFFEVLPFLRDEDPMVRAGAAMALAEIDDGRVKGILDNHVVHERDLHVRMIMDEAVELIEERRKKKRQILEQEGG